MVADLAHEVATAFVVVMIQAAQVDLVTVAMAEEIASGGTDKHEKKLSENSAQAPLDWEKSYLAKVMQHFH